MQRLWSKKDGRLWWEQIRHYDFCHRHYSEVLLLNVWNPCATLTPQRKKIQKQKEISAKVL